MFFQTEQLKWCHNYETDVHTKEHFWPYVCVLCICQRMREKIVWFCFESLFVQLHSLASFHTAWSDHLRELTIHYVWHFDKMHDNRWKSTCKTVPNDYRQCNGFWIYSTTFDILLKTSSCKPLWIHHPTTKLCFKLHPCVTCLNLSLQIRQLILSLYFLFSTFLSSLFALVFLAFAL